MSVQENLRQLFLIDRQLRGLQSRLDGAKRRLKKQNVLLDRLNQQHAELGEQLKQTQATATAREHEAMGVDERIDKLREQMNSAKTNKEYQAFLIEVNTLKDGKGKLEEESLEYLTKVDQLKSESDELEAKAENQKKLVAVAEKEVAECQSEVGDRLEQLAGERAEAAKLLSADVLTLFEKVADENDGDALAAITEQSRRHREYTCGGCFLTIPIERVSSLMTRPDEVVCCPGCNRILYLEAELKESLAR